MKRPSKPGSDAVDLTVVAVPGYFAAMGVEYWRQRRRHARGGAPTAGDYETRDTLASLAMGHLSLLAPFVAPRLLRPVTRAGGGSPRPSSARPSARRRSRPWPTSWPVGPSGGTPAAPAADARRRTTPAPGRRRRPAGSPRSAGWPPSPPAGWPSPPPGPRPPRPSGCGSGGWSDRSAPGPPPWPRPSSAGTSSTTGTTGSCTEPLHVGGPRGPPLERALQPVDGPPPAGGRRARHLHPLRAPVPARDPALGGGHRPGRQPHLPVLDPHRGDRPDRAAPRRSSTRRPTTGSTTGRTGSTSTATTAAS